MKTALKLLALLLVVCTQAYAQSGYFHPEKDGDKWGVQNSYNKYGRKGTEYISEWIHKPKYDLVLYDTLRCGFTGNGCDGFFSFRKGKMGYLWKNGNTLSNEYDALDVYHFVGRKNGKWGGFHEDKNILPFEYDSLLAITYHRPDETGDTLSIRFAAKRNGKWRLIAARTWTKWEQVAVSDIVSTEFESYVKDNVVKKDGKWFFVKTDKGLTYSQPFDSIKHVYDWAVQKNGKWALIYSGQEPSTPYEWDDVMTFTNNYRYLLVKKNGLWGVVNRKKDYAIIIPPQANSITAETESEGTRFFATTNGTMTTFDWTGRVLSNSGDLSVDGTYTAGPFRINRHKDGKVTVLDSASGKVLLEKDYWEVNYANDPVEGHILKLRKLPYHLAQYGKYGRYQYRTGTLIAPVYESDFTDYGPGHFYNSSGTGITPPITFWAKKDYRKLSLPFTVTLAITTGGLRIRDDEKNWYTFSETPVKVDAGTIRYRTNTWGSQVEYDEMQDGAFIITKMNGSVLGQKAEKVTELYNGILLEVKTGDKTTTYAYRDKKAVVCAYTIGTGAYVRDYIWDLEGGPGLLLVDSGSHTILVDPIDNRRLTLPYRTVRAREQSGGKNATGEYKNAYFIEVNDMLYSFCKVSLTAPQICRKEKCSCSGGKIITGTKIVGTPDKYVPAKTTTSTSSNYENTWNPATNSYVGVRTKTTTTHTDPGYTIKGTAHEENTYGKCPRCNGTGELSSSLYWNGKEFR